MRKFFGNRGEGDDQDFRWRGGDVSRIESLSDAVFAFSMTLLIVSLEVPKSFDGLIDTLKQFPAFGISFLFLFMIWYHHYVFFRRYGLNNLSIVAVNGILMFLVLFFVFPFRWLVSFVINFLFFKNFLGIDVPVGIDLTDFNMTKHAVLHTFYAGGMLAIQLCFGWFYYKAYTLRNHLQLDTKELQITVAGVAHNLVVAVICIMSILFVWTITQPLNAHVSGWIFVLIWPASYAVGKWAKKQNYNRLANIPVEPTTEDEDNGNTFL